MRLFSHDQSEVYYLSPYAKVTIRNDRLTVHNTVFDSTAELNCSETIAHELLEKISNGATKDWLLLFFEPFSDGDAKRILDSWIRAGVIE